MCCKIKIFFLTFVLALGMIGCQNKDAEEKNKQKSEEYSENDSQKSEGVYITYQVISDGEPNAEMMNDTVYKLQKRAEMYATNALVYQDGTDCIKVEIPGIDDADSVLLDLGRKGELYFISETAEDGSKNYICTDTTDEDGTYGSVWNLVKTIDELKSEGSIKLYGSDIKNAGANQYSDSIGMQNIVVELTLTDEGSKKFEEATKYAYEQGETLAIYYDGKFISVPKVTSVIFGDKAIISGLATIEESEKIASVIRIGTLKCDIKVMNVEVIKEK